MTTTQSDTTAGPAPTGRADDKNPRPSLQELRAWSGVPDLDTVWLAVTPPTGMLHGKAYDAGYFTDHVLECGTGAAAYLLTADVDMRMLPGFALGGWEHGAGDIRLRPDPGTLRPVGWAPRTALMLADPHDPLGHPYPVAPRAVLARQLTRLATLGLTGSLGIESEAMVYALPYSDAARRGWRELPPGAGHNTDYALAQPTHLAGLIEQIRHTAYASRLPLEGIKTEAGPGQLEVTFRHEEPLKAADAHTVYKLLAHQAAEDLGLALTFMAKPFTGQDGNSCHLHLSLTGPDGRSVLVDGLGRLTALGQHAVAGCLAALGDLSLLMLPTVNSYKRLHTHTDPLFAPTTLSWGYDNRTCALRVIGRGEHGHVECRIPGADAQPHLAAAALIAAIVHGIEHQLPLNHDPVEGNAYADPDAPALPGCLAQAAQRFADSPLALGLLGGDVVAHYAQAARHEVDYHRLRVTDLERERGFERA